MTAEIRTTSGRHIMASGEVVKQTKTLTHVLITNSKVEGVDIGTISKYKAITGAAVQGCHGKMFILGGAV